MKAIFVYHFAAVVNYISFNFNRAAKADSVSKILLKNNLDYPVNLPANELNMYLYGLPKPSLAKNSSILTATLRFINDTNLFDT